MRRSAWLNAGLLLAAGAILLLERKRRARSYVERPAIHRARNMTIAGMAAATVHVLETPVVVPLARMVARRRLGLTFLMGGPSWLRGLVAVLLLDYTLYLWHIIVHRVPSLWRFHLVHHVDLDLDLTTGLRFHAGELTASIPWRAAQVVLIGVTPATLAVWQTLTLLSVLFHHSNTALDSRTERVLAWIIATPRMHAIHHSIDPVQLHSNFSSGLAVWDRLHGTARVDARADEVTVGVAGYLDPQDVTLEAIVALPFATRSLVERA
jgi:sterol desaturase/sphingolipid hydroxylase (fatty acid hydroxylase superfamily)